MNKQEIRLSSQLAGQTLNPTSLFYGSINIEPGTVMSYATPTISKSEYYEKKAKDDEENTDDMISQSNSIFRYYSGMGPVKFMVNDFPRFAYKGRNFGEYFKLAGDLDTIIPMEFTVVSCTPFLVNGKPDYPRFALAGLPAFEKKVQEALTAIEDEEEKKKYEIPNEWYRELYKSGPAKEFKERYRRCVEIDKPILSYNSKELEKYAAEYGINIDNFTYGSDANSDAGKLSEFKAKHSNMPVDEYMDAYNTFQKELKEVK